MRLLCLTLGLAWALPGCVPLPVGGTAYEVPRVRGTLTSDGAPVADVEVWQVASEDDGACAVARDAAAVAVTGADGAFDLPAVSHRRTQVLVSVMEHFTPHLLCFSSGGKTSASWYVFGSAGYRQVPAEVEATCELETSGRVGCEVRPAV